MAKIAAILTLLLITLGASGIAAEERADSEVPARVATHHAIGLGDRRLEYDAIAETLPLTDAKGTVTATVFTVAYLTAAPGRERPVSFVFNGGPGAASVFLHLGALGPRVMETPANGTVPGPPVRLVDNAATWLGFTDLVFVDPVGTGFSRGKGKEENPDKPFWDMRADITSLGTVIRLWLTRHERWTSPIFLVGESYGGFRAATLAQSLPRDVGVTVNGLVLVSPALDLSALHQDERDLLAAAFFLPSYAATAAIHAPRPDRDRAGVERFALSDYLVGLAGLKGEPPPGDPFITKVAEMAGVSEDVVRHHRGRIPRHVFAHEVRRGAGEVVSLYDSTIVRPARPDEQRDEDAADPVLQPAVAAYGAAFNAYAADALGYRTDQPYRVLSPEVSRQWNWQGDRRGDGLGLAMSSLETALLQHPATKVLIANGRYDLVTPYLSSRWLVDQLGVPPGLRAGIRLRVYEGGHMMYMRPESRLLLARDAAELYAATSAAAPSQ